MAATSVVPDLSGLGTIRRHQDLYLFSSTTLSLTEMQEIDNWHNIIPDESYINRWIDSADNTAGKDSTPIQRESVYVHCLGPCPSNFKDDILALIKSWRNGPSANKAGLAKILKEYFAGFVNTKSGGNVAMSPQTALLTFINQMAEYSSLTVKTDQLGEFWSSYVQFATDRHSLVNASAKWTADQQKVIDELGEAFIIYGYEALLGPHIKQLPHGTNNIRVQSVENARLQAKKAFEESITPGTDSVNAAGFGVLVRVNAQYNVIDSKKYAAMNQHKAEKKAEKPIVKHNATPQQRFKAQSSNAQASGATASQQGGFKRGRDYTEPISNESTTNAPAYPQLIRPPCNHCKKPGHKADDCWNHPDPNIAKANKEKSKKK